jgi:cytochrome c-type biogenesis protein
MIYLITFLEGVITFISPCLLPMLPAYVSYFVGQNRQSTLKGAFINALGFVLGFTLVFVLLGTFAGALGRILKEYSTAVNLIAGLIIIVIGLNFIGYITIPFLNQTRQLSLKIGDLGFLSSLLFGIVFSLGWTPCVGAFLGSALMLAASRGESLQGLFLLLSFSLGLGIPFVASALLIERLKSTFDFIKKNYRVINLLSGLLLVLVGILLATGLLGYFLALLSF